MEKIKGVNLGNWLVLEKWMLPELFENTGAEDEVWLNRKLDQETMKEKMRTHRETFITEKDFAFLEKQGINLVRIPVPYFIFGDRSPFFGCIEYLDRAFEWAGKHRIEILIDLHTVPHSQNGYDNGGITGVCKWCKNKDEVEFAISVLERLADRYKEKKELYGIEVLNEPISFPVYITAPSTGKAADRAEAKGSGPVPTSFLEEFYRTVYARLRKILAEDKVIVFHDGFRLRHWGKFFRQEKMKNVLLDTHIYIFAMESFVPIHRPWVYRLYVTSQMRLIERISRDIPVVVGEWCICNRYAEKHRDTETEDKVQEHRKERYREVARLQQTAWNVSAGNIYWSYQFGTDHKKRLDEDWKESWDFCRCAEHGWIS